jgi:hypothetical protein
MTDYDALLDQECVSPSAQLFLQKFYLDLDWFSYPDIIRRVHQYQGVVIYPSKQFQ